MVSRYIIERQTLISSVFTCSTAATFLDMLYILYVEPTTYLHEKILFENMESTCFKETINIFSIDFVTEAISNFFVQQTESLFLEPELALECNEVEKVLG